MTGTQTDTVAQAAERYQQLADKLSLTKGETNDEHKSGAAVEATFITPLDPVIETADGNRLPALPVEEAHKLNALKEKANGIQGEGAAQHRNSKRHLLREQRQQNVQDENLDLALPPLKTHPLFPPLPLYGPPSLLRTVQCLVFRCTSFVLSTGFLLVIVLGAVFTSLHPAFSKLWYWLTFRDRNKKRPFYEEETRRAASRAAESREWAQKHGRKWKRHDANRRSGAPSPSPTSRHEPLEGGPDKLVCDARYYARRVGLEMEKFKVQTEDGFIIDLWHVYDPSEQTPATSTQKQEQGPQVFPSLSKEKARERVERRRYPVLLIHGLLQSAGAYCCNDDDSLAFYLHKAGYDVWLGNNRCGFNPEHALLQPSDPRMWAWNIRQMGVMDLPALISRVLTETSFEKLGLVAHSQGTTQTFVALAKEQRPELGEKISIFCALAPAVYAGPLIGKMYFKFMRLISPGMFRIFFGIHAFIPLMMTMHRVLPAKLYGFMGYLIFGFMFDWSDQRWDRALRDRFFQFAPVYVSSESMRWWLGRECFAKHKCILSTAEDHEDAAGNHDSNEKSRAESAWYDERAPPFALWVAGSDELVDGRRLLQRFEQGREPAVNVVHTKLIEEYEHLDVLWAMDAIEKVGREVKEVIWNTMRPEDKSRCRVIEGLT